MTSDEAQKWIATLEAQLSNKSAECERFKQEKHRLALDLTEANKRINQLEDKLTLVKACSPLWR